MKSKIPIIVLSYNRIDCLYLTISTLLSFIDKDRYNIVVWDNCSDDVRIKDWALGKRVEFKHDYGKLKNFLETIGCKQTFMSKNVFQMPLFDSEMLVFHSNEVNRTSKENGNADNVFSAIDWADKTFSNPDYIHVIENDVILCKECLEIAEKISLVETNVGTVQCGRGVKTILFESNRKTFDGYAISDSDGAAAQYNCLNRKSLEAMKESHVFNSYVESKWFDCKLHHWLYKHGFRVVNFLDKSLYLHIGMTSSVGVDSFQNNMTFNPDFERLKIVGL